MTIEDSLILLNNTKQAIKTAIENKGVTVGSVPFAQYPGKIGDIPTGVELPEIGDPYEGGYFVGLLSLSDGLFANIVSPYTGGDLGNRNHGSGAWSAVEAVDPRVGMSAVPGGNVKTLIQGLTLNGHSDWLIPSWLQAMQFVVESSARQWTGDLSVGGRIWTSLEDSGNSANAFSCGFGVVGIGTVFSTSGLKTQNNRARAFRIKKLD